MSVAESKTNALFDQGFVQTGVMLRKEDKACIVTDMGRVEWFQVNPWGGVQALSAAPAGPWSLGEMTGNWRDIDLPDHGAVMRIVWKMEDDDGRNEKLEAQAHAVVAALNAASPTPPAEARRRYDATAEQAAPKAAPAEQEEAAQRLRKTLDIDPGDVNDPLHPRYIAGFKSGHAAGRRRAAPAATPTPPAEQQAATKAAPAEPPAPRGVPVAWLNPWRADQVTTDYDAYGKHGIPLYTAPQQEAQEPTEIPEEIERMAADRYKVVPSHESMFHRWAVVAGTGTQQLYLGREVECQNMARKFAGAFLDGAFVAMQRTAPQQEAQEPELLRGHRGRRF